MSLSENIVAALLSPSGSTSPSRGRGELGRTSSLSIDETLLLHSIGWEPVELVTGASVSAIAQGTFMYGYGNPDRASGAYTRAVATAVQRINDECAHYRAVGVIGVRMTIVITHHLIEVILTGTGVRPVDGGGHRQTFVSDLSVRDFCLLHGAGWEPVGLAFGASFVQVPRRSIGTALSQSTANVELTNLTTAIYDAREVGMERMQSSALALGGTGMVDVNVEERPLPHARHVVEFRAWGTAIRLSGDGHRYLRPRMVVPINDPVELFKAETLG